MVLRTGSKLVKNPTGEKTEVLAMAHLSETRRSQRKLNLPPEMLGLSTPMRGGRKGKGNEAELNEEVEEMETVAAVSDTDNSVEFSSIPRSAKKNSVSLGLRSLKSSNSSRNTVVQRRQLELEAIKELDRIESEEAALLQRKKERIQKMLELNQAELEDGASDSDDEKENDVDVAMANSHRTYQPEVVDWLRGVESEEVPENQDRRVNFVRTSPHSHPIDLHSRFENFHDNNNHRLPIDSLTQMNVMNENMAKLLARQSVSKDLPAFSRESEEWPMFIPQYSSTTELCWLSDDENLVRLQKCLKGRAREAVLPILGIPYNVPRIMKTLELTFGRTDQIIKNLILKIKTAPFPKESKPDSLIRFSNTFDNLVGTMQSLRCIEHIRNPGLMEKMLGKLPSNLQLQWCMKPNSENGRIDEFANWLRTISVAASRMPAVNGTFGKDLEHQLRQDAKSKTPPKKPVLTSVEKEKDPPAKNSCFKCGNSGHSIYACKEFQNDDIDNRWKLVTDNKLCFNCLGKGHQITSCTKKDRCGEDGCERRHNRLLHKSAVAKQVERREDSQSDSKQWCGHTSLSSMMKDVLLRVIPVKLSGPAGEIESYALLDEASTVTLLDANVADKLGLAGRVDPLCIQWTNDVEREENNSRSVNLKISGIHANGKQFQIFNARTTENLALQSQSIDMEMLKKGWPYLNDVAFASMREARPVILIGQDNVLLTTARKVVQGSWRDPVATKTWLGWVVHGVVPRRNRIDTAFTIHICHKENCTADDELAMLMKGSFSTEEFGVRVLTEKARSKEDKLSLKILDKTTRRIGNRFETGLLWKSHIDALPESRSNAMHRLRCMERKMDKDPVFAEAYCKKIQELQDKGYARKLTYEEAAKRKPKTYYLAHFAVSNPNKPGKLRLIFDAAAKSQGLSLNDSLMTGPDLLTPLPAVILRFRIHRYGFVADIEEMFPQGVVIEEDQDSQRFLWRGMERGDNPEEHVMLRLIMGATCSPCSAAYIKNKNAEEFKEDYPHVYQITLECFYVDDELTGSHTETEGINVILDVVEVFKRGGFNLRNWLSNSEKIMEGIPEDLRASSYKSHSLDPEDKLKRVLGLYWNPKKDSFTFSLNFHRVDPKITGGSKIPTKREVYKLIMSVYDPLGFLTNFTIKGRIINQMIWRSGIDWDETIDERILQDWADWLKLLQEIPRVSIPRCYSWNLKEARSVQLHIFCDASEEAFATVAYLRVECEVQTEVSFIMARARVAPLKPISIPRLELQASVMAARISQTIRTEIGLEFQQVHFWSDSKTVLAWIRSDARKFQTFVAHRVGEILEATGPGEWHWVPTDLNVADEATRLSSRCDFLPTSRWFNGPDFLKLDHTMWPKETEKINPDECMEEIKKQFVCLQINKQLIPLPDVSRFSKWSKLIRSTAWVLRFLNNFRAKYSRNPKETTTSELTAEELNTAEILWWKSVQSHSFSNDIRSIESAKSVEKSRRLWNLSPLIDSEGVLRIDGRLKNADIPSDTITPVILDPHHRFTQLLISEYHCRSNHQGIETVANELRQRYRVLNLRAAVKKSFHSCQRCKVRKAKPFAPRMGVLPPERLAVQTSAFVNTGLDYFGPMMVTVGRHREKEYGALFTCLSTRAVFVELADSLSTDSAKMTIRRFAARRGHPTKIFFDNGTNFRGASNELRAAVANLDSGKIQVTLAGMNPRIDWNFIPPGSPHMGGSWERLVKSVKTALSATLKEQAPREEVSRTLLAEVENIVNSRPLTHVSVDPTDEISLTPNCFLNLNPRGVPTPGEFSDSDLYLRKRWWKCQRIPDHFWARWVKEYLPTLTRRTKWYDTTNPIKVNDVVVVADKDGPRNSWPMGIIVNVFSGKDGHVRVVDVKTKDGIYRRPVTKICILDVHDEKD